MTKPIEARQTPAVDRDRIIIALDVSTADAAREIIRELGGAVGAFKIGLQLFSAAGPGFVRELVKEGHRIFLDLKFHDIPNTVAAAAVEAARMGVWMFNVHASGGSEMMERTVAAVDETCSNEGLRRPLMIGVTVLTSSDEGVLDETGISGTLDDQVLRLAALSKAAGLDGVVASAREAQLLRRHINDPDFAIVTPGIRPNSATADDQKRVTTVRGALADGASYLVVGRPVTQADNKLTALESMLEADQ